ncbi:hypothetical protein JGC07_24595, partial [Salmonella enterica subsp. enterica serovar Corvallis]|nr:hypothetical protein [Salmonella enterica subsp. enterica serovar Corvallis]
MNRKNKRSEEHTSELQSDVCSSDLRTGQLDDEDWARISGTMGILLEKRN